MTNNDIDDMIILDPEGIPIPMSFMIKCIKGVDRNSEKEINAFCVGKIVTVVHFETAFLEHDEAPFLLESWYQGKGGGMVKVQKYFSLESLATMMPDENYVKEKQKNDNGYNSATFNDLCQNLLSNLGSFVL